MLTKAAPTAPLLCYYYVMNLKQFFGVPPNPATRAGILPGTKAVNGEEETDISRRGFLSSVGKLAASAVVTSVGLGFIAEEAEAKDQYTAFKNNEIGRRKFIDFLNNKNIPHVLNNPKANDIDIYNDLEKIMKDWHNGKFQENQAKYYKPKSFANLIAMKKKYEDDEQAFLNGEVLRKFNLKADYLSVGEIQGANSEEFTTKGFMVLKKGTELYTKEVNGVKKTYIAECFNQLYAGEPLCTPCPEGVICKK